MNIFNQITHPNCYDAYKYALDVVVGDVPACVYVRGACERFINDLEDGFYPFDADKAERYLRIVQLFTHVKGNWGSDLILYEPWQKFIFANIMGFIDPRTGQRRFRVAHVEIPRGQGKSAMASQMALFFLALDNPKGNEISCLATKTDQARIVLDSARAMAKANSKFLKSSGVEVYAHRIIHEKSNSFVRALSSDDKSLDGLNDILAICDELHAMSRELFDVISSGMSKRNDSLLLCITTAGSEVDGVGFTQSEYARKVAKGEHKDDQFFSIVYTIDEGDDIFEESTWIKANPNWGVSVDPITFRAKAEKARITPADLPNFKIKHLNVWISEASAYFDMEAWDKCADKTLKLEDFKGQKCYSGIDLASKVDLAGFGHIFRKDGIYYLFSQAYLPEKALKDKKVDIYETSKASGHLIVTPGEAIHYEQLQNDFEAFSKNHKIEEAMYDPWSATQFAQNLNGKRIEMVEFNMRTGNLSEPTKALAALILQRKVRHDGSPLLRWCFSNVVCKEDAAQNVFPKKSHERLKIDLAIALIMAYAGWTQEKKTDSVYETRGIRVLR